MGDTPKIEPGSIIWTDLTVKDAGTIKEFYEDVIGWKTEAVSMGDYSDFNMNAAESGNSVAGVCHARGTNAGLPAAWLIYITVSDVHESASRCKARGGKVLVGPKSMGSHGTYCVIEDPAGAVAALIQPAG